MASQHSHRETVRAFAGSVLAGSGLFLLGHVVGVADHLSRFFGRDDGAGLGIVSSIMAASLDPHYLAHALLALLWPGFLVVVGTALLCGGASDEGFPPQNRPNDPCVGCA